MHLCQSTEKGFKCIRRNHMTFKSKHKTTVVKEQKMETGTNLVKGCSVKVSLIRNHLTHTEEFQISDSFSFQWITKGNILASICHFLTNSNGSSLNRSLYRMSDLTQDLCYKYSSVFAFSLSLVLLLSFFHC